MVARLGNWCGVVALSVMPALQSLDGVLSETSLGYIANSRLPLAI